MYLWEMVAARLRAEGWTVWHQVAREGGERSFVVHAHRPGQSCLAVGPTLTEAFAAAARKARERRAEPGPHFNARPAWAV